MINIKKLKLKQNLNEYIYIKLFVGKGIVHEVILKTCIK